MESNIKGKLKESLLLSAGLFILGKKRVEELVRSLEENGMTKQEAEKTANDVLNSAKTYKENFLKNLSEEIKKRNLFATKSDVEKIEKELKEISKKIDSQSIEE